MKQLTKKEKSLLYYAGGKHTYTKEKPIDKWQCENCGKVFTEKIKVCEVCGHV